MCVCVCVCVCVCFRLLSRNAAARVPTPVVDVDSKSKQRMLTPTVANLKLTVDTVKATAAKMQAHLSASSNHAAKVQAALVLPPHLANTVEVDMAVDALIDGKWCERPPLLCECICVCARA